MTRRLPAFKLPQWSPTLNFGTIEQWRRELTRLLQDALTRVIDQVNSQVQGLGEDLTVSGVNATVTASAAIHHIGGTGSLQYIYLPVDQVGTTDTNTSRRISSFTGPIFVIPTAAWSIVNTGVGSFSIASANGTVTVGKLIVFTFDGSQWYCTR